MRVFPDTNVLVSAFTARGLCANLIELVLKEHELLIGDVVLDEFRAVLRTKFRMATEPITRAETLLKRHRVVGRPLRTPRVRLADSNDLLVLASAMEAGSEVLVTGDAEILRVHTGIGRLKIRNPRQCWELLRGTTPSPPAR